MKKITLKQPGGEAYARNADEWVSGGGTRTTRGSDAKPARLTIDLPQELHSLFKAACARERTRMRDEVLRFIEKWTQEHS
jgi:hypothetical protein